MRLPISRALMLTAFAFAGEPAAAQLATDMKLEDAGFTMRAARNARDMELLKRMPPRKFIKRDTAGGAAYYYADPQGCQCVFVGNAAAMQAYRDMRGGVGQPDKVPASGINETSLVAQDMAGDLNDEIGAGDILDPSW